MSVIFFEPRFGDRSAEPCLWAEDELRPIHNNWIPTFPLQKSRDPIEGLAIQEMAPILSQSLHLSILVLFLSSILAATHEDPTRRTMEEFSGYPTDPPHSFLSLSPSFLSVDKESLQRQIDELSTFSDTPAPSVTRVLYSEKDVLARRYLQTIIGIWIGCINLYIFGMIVRP